MSQRAMRCLPLVLALLLGSEMAVCGDEREHSSHALTGLAVFPSSVELGHAIRAQGDAKRQLARPEVLACAPQAGVEVADRELHESRVEERVRHAATRDEQVPVLHDLARLRVPEERCVRETVVPVEVVEAHGARASG